MGHCPTHQEVAGLIPGQGMFLGCGIDPWPGHIREASNRRSSLTSMFFSLSVPLSLKSNKHTLWIKKNTHGFIHAGCTCTRVQVLVFSAPTSQVTDHVQECWVTAADSAAATLVGLCLGQNVKRPRKPKTRCSEQMCSHTHQGRACVWT